MPGIESFSRSSSGTTSARGTISFAEPGGSIQIYSETPLGQQQAIYNRILETQGPGAPVEPAPPINVAPDLGSPLPDLKVSDYGQKLPDLKVAETAAKTTAVAAGGIGATEVVGGVAVAANAEILIPIGIGLLALGATAAIYDQFKEAPDKVDLAPSSTVVDRDFTGGQETGVQYKVGAKVYRTSISEPPSERGLYAYGDGEGSDFEAVVTGPVTKVVMEQHPEIDQLHNNVATIYAGGTAHAAYLYGYEPGWFGLKNIKVTRVDGQPEPEVIFPPPSAYPQPALSPDTGLAPGASHLPYAEPPAKSLPLGLDLLPSQSQKQPQTVELPKGTTITITSPGATPTTITTSKTEPSTLKLPGKVSQGEATPLSISTPSGKPVTFSTPGTGPVTISIPGYDPITVNPTGQTKTTGLTRSSNPTQTSFTPTASTKAGTGKTDDDKKDDTKTPAIDPAVLTGLAAITTILQGLQKNVTPEAIQAAAAAGTCQTVQPGNCLSPTADNAKSAAENSKANGNKLDQLNTALQGLDLGLLKVMDNKLGPQLAGGLSGKLGRLSQWLRIDRALNLLTYAAVLHNAMMLSNDFVQTLISATNAFIKAFILKDDEADSFDLSTVLGKSIEDATKSIFGAKTVAYWEVQWKKYNRIYQAAANVISRFTNITLAIFTVLEVGFSRVSKIGNALKWYGDVGDKAYETMNESDNFQHPIFIKMQRLQEAASAIETVSSSVTTIKDEYKGLETDKKELQTAINKATTKNQKDDDAEIKKILTSKVDESIIE